MNIQIEQHLGDITHWVSKSGTFVYGRDVISRVAPELSTDEVTEIYNFVKANSLRMETEWRPDFLTIFPNSAGLLPEVDPSEFWGARLHLIVESGHSQSFVEFVAELGADEWRLEGSDFNVYPFEAEDENGESPVNKAIRFGHIQIAEKLEELIQKIKIG